MARLKVRLVAKGYSQLYEMVYLDTLFLVAKMTSVRILVSLAATYDWPFHPLNIKNAFLNDILDEEVCIEQPLGFFCSAGSVRRRFAG